MKNLVFLIILSFFFISCIYSTRSKIQGVWKPIEHKGFADYISYEFSDGKVFIKTKSIIGEQTDVYNYFIRDNKIVVEKDYIFQFISDDVIESIDGNEFLYLKLKKMK